MHPLRSSENDVILSRFITRSELADWYGITVKTLNARLKREGLHVPPLIRISPQMLKTIIEVLGPPPPQP